MTWTDLVLTPFTGSGKYFCLRMTVSARTSAGAVSTPDLIAHDSKSFYAFFYVGSTEQLIVATSDLLDILKVLFNTGFFGLVCSLFPHRSRWFATMPPMCGGMCGGDWRST